MAVASDAILLRRVESIGAEIDQLVFEAEIGGHSFMKRLRDEWASGANRFDGFGELLLAAHMQDRLVGIGGLNKDPYAIGEIGRLRHVYVLANVRRKGIGTLLVKRIIDEAKTAFSVVRLRTNSVEAADFYLRLGFRQIKDAAATHVMILEPSEPKV